MRKRLLAVILSIVLVVSALPVWADSVVKPAQALEQLGLLQGDGEGVNDTYLAKQMDRLTAAIVILKMNGVYDAAAGYQGDDQFPDGNQVQWPEGRSILMYLKANPSYGFGGLPNGNFEPYASIDEDSFLKVMLENLGWKYQVDFTWEQIRPFAVEKGLSVPDEAIFTIKNLAEITDSALKATVKNESTSLIEQLVNRDALDRQKAMDAGYLKDSTPVGFAVKEISVPNLKQVRITYTQPVKEESEAKDPVNYIVAGSGDTVGSYITKTALSADQRTVTLTLAKALANGTTNNRVTVLKEVGLDKDYVDSSVRAFDTTAPTIEGVEAIGPKEIDILFSEPIQVSGTKCVVLDDGTYKVGTLRVEEDTRLRVITSSEFTEGAHTLSVMNEVSSRVSDYNNNVVQVTDYAFDYEKDTRAVTAEILDVEATKSKLSFTVKYNKPILPNSLEYRLDKDRSSKKSSSVLRVSDSEYRVSYTEPAPAVDFTVYLTSADNKKPATDKYGVTIPNMHLQGVIVPDGTRPEVRTVEYLGNSLIQVTFNKLVNRSDAMQISNYTLKDPSGDKISLKSLTDADYREVNGKSIVVLRPQKETTFETGTYTLEMKSVRDQSIYENKLIPATIEFTCKDETAPSVTAAVKSNGTTVKVVFTKAMEDAIGDADNWYATGATLKNVEVDSGNKGVTLTFNDTGQLQKLQSRIFKDQEGNNLKAGGPASISGSNVNYNLSGLTGIKPKSASLVAPDQIEILVENAELDGADDRSFIVYDGSDTVRIDNAYCEYRGGNTVIHIAFGYALDNTRAIGLKVEMRKTAEITTPYGAKLSMDKMPVEDKCGPYFRKMGSEIKSFYPSGAPEKLRIYFTEAVYGASLEDADFSIYGYTVDHISAGSQYVDIWLEDEEEAFGKYDTVEVNLVGDIEDKSGNTNNDDYISLGRDS